LVTSRAFSPARAASLRALRPCIPLREKWVLDAVVYETRWRISYPPREKWVFDAVVYETRWRISYPLREKWVLDAVAYEADHSCSWL